MIANMMRLNRIFLACALLLTSVTTPTKAQDQQKSPSTIASEIANIHPKTVVFVFDISMSTKHAGVFTNERAATAAILHKGCGPGDRVALIKFGTGATTVFDKTLTSREDAVALIDQIPLAPEPGRGTNIRLPHSEALQLVQDGKPNPGVVVLLTDSFNDQPLETDPNYASYTNYYTTKLTVYPKTSENASYENLLKTLKGSGELKEYGVGVGIAPSGRPIERLPVGPDESDSPDAASVVSAAPLADANMPTRKTTDTGLLLFGCFGAVILGLALAFWFMSRPSMLRLRLGDKAMPRDYRLKSGRKVGLGGSLTTTGPGDDFFPLAGIDTPAAFVTASGGGFTLIPNGAVITTAKVFHNGVPLEKQSPLRIGDEIRVTLPADDNPVPREYRIRFADPKAPVF